MARLRTAGLTLTEAPLEELLEELSMAITKLGTTAGDYETSKKVNEIIDATGTATTATAGVVKQAAAQADTTAVDLAALKVDFNALLAKLRTAGILAP